MSYFMVYQGCHQLLWNVLHYVSTLVTDESTATAGEALGVIALQMMGLALQDRGYDISIFCYFSCCHLLCRIYHGLSQIITRV
jgi:hypothetical protein